MIDKELVKQHIIDLELSIESKVEQMKKLRKEIKLERKQLRDSKILWLQAGGEE
jgi:hypothetical protein